MDIDQSFPAFLDRRHRWRLRLLLRREPAQAGPVLRYLASISHYSWLSADEEDALLRRVRAADDPAAARLLLEGGLSIVVQVAITRCSDPAGLFDLIQDGNLFLLSAIHRRVFHTCGSLRGHLAARMGQQAYWHRADRSPRGPSLMGWTFPDPVPDPESLLVQRESLQRAIASLPPREQLIVEGRWLAPAPISHAALGHQIGVSGDRVRRIEAKSLARLRKRLAASPSKPGNRALRARRAAQRPRQPSVSVLAGPGGAPPFPAEQMIIQLRRLATALWHQRFGADPTVQRRIEQMNDAEELRLLVLRLRISCRDAGLAHSVPPGA